MQERPRTELTWLRGSRRQDKCTGLEVTEWELAALQREEWAASFPMDSPDINGKGQKGGGLEAMLTAA